MGEAVHSVGTEKDVTLFPFLLLSFRSLYTRCALKGAFLFFFGPRRRGFWPLLSYQYCSPTPLVSHTDLSLRTCTRTRANGRQYEYEYSTVHTVLYSTYKYEREDGERRQMKAKAPRGERYRSEVAGIGVAEIKSPPLSVASTTKVHQGKSA